MEVLNPTSQTRGRGGNLAAVHTEVQWSCLGLLCQVTLCPQAGAVLGRKQLGSLIPHYLPAGPPVSARGEGQRPGLIGCFQKLDARLLFNRCSELAFQVVCFTEILRLDRCQDCLLI